MPGDTAVVRVLWFVVVLAGCSEWPRFSNLPADDLQPATGSASLEEVAVEDDTTEFPRDPRDLSFSTLRQVGGAYDGLKWGGQLGWAGAVGGFETFGCDLRIETEYEGDIDFFAFAHQGGGLCITVAPGLPGDPSDACGSDAQEPLWEMPLFKYDSSTGCPIGEWFNETTVDQQSGNGYPEAYGLDRRALFFPRLEAGEYVLFLSGVCGTYSGMVEGACPDREGVPDALPCVPYQFAVAVVPTQEACNQVHDDLAGAQR